MSDNAKRRVAIIGTGFRGTGTWGRELLANCGHLVELVGLADANSLRLERARAAIGADVPTFADLAGMLAATRPDTLIVCTRDSAHDGHIVQALEAGVDVLTEKPMATTAEKVRRILAAERRTGRRLDVAFNYRFSPTAERIKEVLASGVIGEIVSVDFHWYLDVVHGADYFRRWHAYLENSGGLFVHKATHHFDLLNWYLESDPAEVFARGALRHYGRMGPFRGTRCKVCAYAATCEHHVDIGANQWLDYLYEAPSAEDGYFRDACVFREDIDIPDTMSAAIRYANGVQVAYSLNTFMPIEGYHLAFNGQRGRVEIRQFERQAWETPDADEILLARNFGPAERIVVPHRAGGHFGGDPALQKMIFAPGQSDPLKQRAGSRAGALSVLCGVAAMESARRGVPVAVLPLLEPELIPLRGRSGVMTQNIYDNDEFFAEYGRLRRSLEGLDGAQEWPVLRSMLPAVSGLRILDLGCGYGWFCRWARENGAAHVQGIDVSEKMLDRARATTDDAGITFVRADMEKLELPGGSFDLVYSSLALHYVENLNRLMSEVRSSLLPGGALVFSVEHPIMTALAEPKWFVDGEGRKTWPVDGYLDEGPRSTDWLAKGVIKQHRTLATYVNTLIRLGFALTRIEEWGPSEEQVASWPSLAGDHQRPPFLLVSATR